MVAGGQDLSVRSESVQRLYALYVSDRFQVNRRYQRKLVWSVEEKERLMDSMLKDLPLPLFLVAEIASDGGFTYELIDGLQRLNAIFAFLENEFAVGGHYFDLDALADTKLRKDQGLLTQKQPLLSRQESAAFANYTAALSVFRAEDESSVEEVFRRINSGGRRLSRQSLRQAGTISPLADLVRIVSSRIRGDTSPSESVPLRRMPQLSITNYSLDYGVNVDDIFWVRNGVLRREDVRESLDEQLVLDILIDCVTDPIPTSGTRIRDDYYSFGDSDDPSPSRASTSISLAIEMAGLDAVADSFMKAYDEIRTVLAASDKRFSALINAGSGGRAPRYFHGVFLAFYELLFRDNLRVRDYAAAGMALTNVGANMSVPGGGGDWTGPNKRTTIDAVKGVIRSSFEGPVKGDDLACFGYASQLETLLGNALVEQQLFDCKQGFYTLNVPRVFDDASLSKIARTLSAMANAGKGAVGYIAVGIADSEADADRIRSLDGTTPSIFRGFRIVGIDREATICGKPLSDYWHWVVQKIAATRLEAGLAASIASSARLVSYHGHAVGLLKVEAGSAPSFFGDEMYERSGSDTLVVPRSDYLRLYRSFA